MADFDKKAYDIEYNRKNVFTKRVPFNRANPEDARMLEFLEREPNFTQYVKGLIYRDMLQRKEEQK